MKAEYKRDMNHNYLILRREDELDTDSYQVRMLVGNGMPSLLKCRIQGIDGKFLIYYDITSRQSVASLYEKKKFGIEDLKIIFGGFVKAMEEMAEYLMNPGQLLVQPEYMYLDVEKKKLYFCCMPGKSDDIREEFRVLTEYILPKIDHEDGAAVILGYGVYRRALEDTFHLEYIKEEIYKGREKIAAGISGKKCLEEECGENTQTRWEQPGQMKQKEQTWEPDSSEIFGIREGEAVRKGTLSLRKKILFSVLGAVLLMGLAAASVLGVIPGIQMEILLGSAVVILGAGMLVYMVQKRLGNKSESLRENQREEIKHREREYTKTDGEEPVPYKENEENVSEFYEERPKIKDFGETVVLSASAVEGPATLVSREPGELATIYLQEDMTVIGKMETAVDAVIDIPTVSRIHAKIRRRDNEYYLSDLNSRNGTAVNGRLLKEGEDYQLQNEDEVDFAQARYVFLK